MAENIWVVLAVSLSGPLLGSLAGVLIRPRPAGMYAMLSFAGGTMLAISFLEMLPESLAMCGAPATIAGILVGLLVMLLLTEVFPHLRGNTSIEDAGKVEMENLSLLMVAAIFLHNFPEGMAMASGASMSQGGKMLFLAVALAVHDIPEGICTSAPYYYATGRRLKAFLLSASTALPVLAGFFLGRKVFAGLSDFTMGTIIAAIAGLMIYVSCEELIPTSQKGDHPRFSMTALMMGIIVVLVMGMLEKG